MTEEIKEVAIEEEKVKGIDFRKVPKEWKWLIDCGLIEENGLRISGMGMLANNTKQLAEKVDKIQKFVYFMEKRQRESYETRK